MREQQSVMGWRQRGTDGGDNVGGRSTGVSKAGERRREEEQQQFATEGNQVGGMSGREQEKTLWWGCDRANIHRHSNGGKSEWQVI